MQTGGQTSPFDLFTRQDNGDHYDQLSLAYSRYWGDHIHHGLFLNGEEDAQRAQEMMVRHCAARAELRAGMRVADVGCGHGITAAFLAREYSCHVLGLTISRKQVKLAKKN